MQIREHTADNRFVCILELQVQEAWNKACLLLLPPCTLTPMLSTMAPLIILLKYFNKTTSAFIEN